jgi:hypothetical protein
MKADTFFHFTVWSGSLRDFLDNRRKLGLESIVHPLRMTFERAKDFSIPFFVIVIDDGLLELPIHWLELAL